MNHVNKKHGFTLIELVLAMGFVSALLLAIAMTVIQIGNIYNRGLTLKEVDQAGRSIASELQRSISSSAPFETGPVVGSRYIQQDWGGRLCLGQYSYIWNYGKDIQSNDPSRLNIYSNSAIPIRFVKVFDANTSYCTKIDDTEEYKKIDPSDAVELLNIGQHNLAIHQFAITAKATAGDSKTGQQLYSIEFLIGTNDQTAINSNSTCKIPSELGSDLSYCSINQFDIVVRAGNKVE